MFFCFAFLYARESLPLQSRPTTGMTNDFGEAGYIRVGERMHSQFLRTGRTDRPSVRILLYRLTYPESMYNSHARSSSKGVDDQ